MKKAFSLIELLIVIAIISLFGFMVFGFLKKAEIKEDPYTIKNLKDALAGKGDAELVCVDKCSKCFIRSPGSNNLQKTQSNLGEITAYILDSRDDPQKLEFGRLDDHKVCLRYRHYANGSSSQMILESDGKFFYFPSYFGEVSTHDSLQDAAEVWLEGSKMLTSKGNYY